MSRSKVDVSPITLYLVNVYITLCWQCNRFYKFMLKSLENAICHLSLFIHDNRPELTKPKFKFITCFHQHNSDIDLYSPHYQRRLDILIRLYIWFNGRSFSLKGLLLYLLKFHVTYIHRFLYIIWSDSDEIIYLTIVDVENSQYVVNNTRISPEPADEIDDEMLDLLDISKDEIEVKEKDEHPVVDNSEYTITGARISNVNLVKENSRVLFDHKNYYYHPELRALPIGIMAKKNN